MTKLLRRSLRIIAFGVIAAQRQDVLDALLLQLIEHAPQVFRRGVDAAQVRDALDLPALLDHRRDLHGIAGRRSSCAICDADEIRLELSQLIDRTVDRRDVSILVLRRKDLKGQRRTLSEQFTDLHVHSSFL